MSRRICCQLNANIQWFHPPLHWGGAAGELEPSSVGVDQNGAMTGIDPELWATELNVLFERLWSSAVGRAVISSVRRRTTVYPADRAQTDYDPYDDGPAPFPLERQQALARAAATIGANALILFNIHGRTEMDRGAARWEPTISLLHELIHAVNITWGNYQLRISFSSQDARRFGVSSPEEEVAWIIDNMYRSERHLWLRRQYDGGAMLPPRSGLTPAATGTDLDASETRVVSRLRQRVTLLATALASIDERTCPYNPFRRPRW